jgi:hypothetical protein
MDKDDRRDLGMLCCGCEYDSYQLPDVEGISDDERQMIEGLCKICIESSKLRAVNA